MSSTVTGSLPPEGHHGGHLGGRGGASGFWRGKAPGSPQPSCLLPLRGSFSREGRGTWLPDPRPPCPPLSPDDSHPEAWLAPSLRIQLWGQLHFKLIPPHPSPAVTPPFLVSGLKLAASPPSRLWGQPCLPLRTEASGGEWARSLGALAVPECALSRPGPGFGARGRSWRGDRGHENGQAGERAAG